MNLEERKKRMYAFVKDLRNIMLKHKVPATIVYFSFEDLILMSIETEIEGFDTGIATFAEAIRSALTSAGIDPENILSYDA